MGRGQLCVGNQGHRPTIDRLGLVVRRTRGSEEDRLIRRRPMVAALVDDDDEHYGHCHDRDSDACLDREKKRPIMG